MNARLFHPAGMVALSSPRFRLVPFRPVDPVISSSSNAGCTGRYAWLGGAPFNYSGFEGVIFERDSSVDTGCVASTAQAKVVGAACMNKRAICHYTCKEQQGEIHGPGPGYMT